MKIIGRHYKKKKHVEEIKYLVDNEIYAKKVKLVDGDGKYCGIVSIQDAYKIADGAEVPMNLVQFTYEDIPIVKVLNYDKLRYQLAAKQKQNEVKNKRTTQLKEIKIQSKIEDNDYNIKLKHAIDWLQAGYKLKITIMSYGRAAYRQDIKMQFMERILNDIKEKLKVTVFIKSDVRNIYAIITH